MTWLRIGIRELIVLMVLTTTCQAGNEDDLKLLTLSRKSSIGKLINGLRVVMSNVEIRKYSNRAGISIFDTPAGGFSFGAGLLPKGFQAPDDDSLILIENDKQHAVFEHVFPLEKNGLQAQWLTQFRVVRGIPGVLVQSRLINLNSYEKMVCYQVWSTNAISENYYTDSGRKKTNIPVAQLDMGDWIFFQMNEKGGIGMIVDQRNDAVAIFSNQGSDETGLWGIRLVNQRQPVFKEGAGSRLVFFLFFAESPETAQKLYEKIKKESIFPEIWERVKK